MLGQERLAESLRGGGCQEARLVVKQCFAELEELAPARLHDDVTVVVLCRTAQAPYGGGSDGTPVPRT